MTIGSALLTNWSLSNLDKNEQLEGDFEAQNVTRNVGVTYTEHHTLSRENPIQQFVHGNVDTLSFVGRFFVDPAILSLSGLPFAGLALLPSEIKPEGRLGLRPAEKLAVIEKWASVDPDLGRPPRVLFSVGNGELSQISVITSISDIAYDRPLLSGEVRGVSFTMNLSKFIVFDIEVASRPPPSTRFHHIKTREYFELVAEREYGTAILGDIIRKQHPAIGTVNGFPDTGDVIKLPSLLAIQQTQVIPRSIQLQNLTEDGASPQRDLRQLVIDRLNIRRFSPIVPEGI